MQKVTSALLFITAGILFTAIGIVAYVASTLFWGEGITKADLRQRVEGGVAIGATRQQVEAFLDSLVIKGVRATKHDYVHDESNHTFTAEGREIEVDGTIFAVMRGGRLWPFFSSVGAIFYFDRSQRLVNYHIDYVGRI